jgi:hypothetical protein
MGNQLTKKERDQITNLLIKYENVFAFSMKDLGRCKTMQFSIDLTDETSVYRRRHRLSKHEWEPQDRYPMPIPEELFDSIGDSNIFIIVDLRQGFN